MACACSSGPKAPKGYVWTSADGTKTLERTSLVEVKYLVSVKGGTYAEKK